MQIQTRFVVDMRNLGMQPRESQRSGWLTCLIILGSLVGLCMMAYGGFNAIFFVVAIAYPELYPGQSTETLLTGAILYSSLVIVPIVLMLLLLIRTIRKARQQNRRVIVVLSDADDSFYQTSASI